MISKLMKFKTTDYFWDCECLKNYIHKKSEVRHCVICDKWSYEQPDSRINEVVAAYPDSVELFK